ncbi:MAG: outer membrane protein assembly factor BamA, partial [Deltaproteobacteria bacterium]|nr:outer membrane protein assembly factor BamA [Deltaproteobacteria bacterium]
MKNFRSVIILFFVTCLFLLSCNNIFAETATKVVIIPFTLDAQTPDPEMRKKIPSMLGQMLEKEGAKVEYLSDFTESVQDWTHEQFSRLGLQKGADYLLTGSMFVAGESVSIDS